MKTENFEVAQNINMKIEEAVTQKTALLHHINNLGVTTGREYRGSKMADVRSKVVVEMIDIIEKKIHRIH